MSTTRASRSADSSVASRISDCFPGLSTPYTWSYNHRFHLLKSSSLKGEQNGSPLSARTATVLSAPRSWTRKLTVVPPMAPDHPPRFSSTHHRPRLRLGPELDLCLGPANSRSRTAGFAGCQPVPRIMMYGQVSYPESLSTTGPAR